MIDKIKELILYVAKRSETDATFGATKLNKLLYFCDFYAYRKAWRTITGVNYQKLENGPAPRCMLPVRAEMVEAGELRIVPTEYFGFPQERVVALRPADLSSFGEDMVSVVDRVIDRFWGMTATEISKFSHRFPGWDLARLGENIPPESALLEYSHTPSREDLETAASLEGVAASIGAEAA
jgi:uncharacterized phage-associated protein